MKNNSFLIMLILALLLLPQHAFSGITIDGALVETTNILNADQINMNPAETEPTAFSEGSLYWDGLSHAFKGYDGTSWQDFQMGSAIWGSITGTLSNQTDLQSALDGKVSRAGDTITGDLGISTLEVDRGVLFNISGKISANPNLTFDPDHARLYVGGDISISTLYMDSSGEIIVDEGGLNEVHIAPWGYGKIGIFGSWGTAVVLDTNTVTAEERIFTFPDVTGTIAVSASAGLSETYNFDATTSGNIASMTFENGILTAVTTLP